MSGAEPRPESAAANGAPRSPAGHVGAPQIRDTLLRNTFWYGLVTFFGIAVGIVMSVVLARGLGPTQMGEFSYVLWATRTMAAVATLGFAIGTVRYTASAIARDDRALAWGIVHHLKRRQIAVATLVVGLTLPFVFVFAPESMRWPFVVMALGLFPITMEHIYSHALYGANRYDLTAQTSTVKMTLQLVAAIASLALGFGMVGLAIGIVGGSVVSTLIQARRAQSIYPANGAPVPDVVRRELRGFLVPLSVVVVLDALVWDRSEVFFLRFWMDPREIAFYSLAFGLATKAMIVPEITTGPLLPTFSALHGRGAIEEFRQVYRVALRNVVLVGVPISAVLAAIGPGLVTFLYGDEYRPVATLLGVMVVIATFVSTRKVAWMALRGLGDQRCMVPASGIAALLNIGAAILFIPTFHTWGAVLASTLGRVFATVTAFVVLARGHGCRPPMWDFARISVAGVLAYGATLSVAPESAGLLRLALGAGVGFATYVAAVLALRVVGPRDWQVIVGALKRRSARRTGSPPPAAVPVKPAPTEV